MLDRCRLASTSQIEALLLDRRDYLFHIMEQISWIERQLFPS